MKSILKISVLTGLVALGCRDDQILKGTPSCVSDRIERLKSEGVRNPPAKVYRYQYQGKTVYYIPPYCCDAPSVLLDESCNVLCSPDGGFGGGGDGRCPDFFTARSNQELVWEDARK